MPSNAMLTTWNYDCYCNYNQDNSWFISFKVVKHLHTGRNHTLLAMPKDFSFVLTKNISQKLKIKIIAHVNPCFKFTPGYPALPGSYLLQLV